MSKEINTSNLKKEVLRIRKNKKSPTALISSVLDCDEATAKHISSYIGNNPSAKINFDEWVGLGDKQEVPVPFPIEAKHNSEVVPTNLNDEKSWAKAIEFKDKYVYNKDTDTYIIYCKTAHCNINVSGAKLRAMQQAYSNWKGKGNTINEICRNFQFPRAMFNDLKIAMGWTHDLEPVTKEDLLSKEEDTIVEELLQQKRFSLHEKFTKADWQETQADATKWRKFQYGEFDPFVQVLNSWVPKTIPTALFTNKNNKPVTKNTFLIALSDLHFGAKSNAEELFTGENYNSQAVLQIVDDYTKKIQAAVAERSYKFEKATICVLGDILHTLTGCTSKGTVLETDTLREEQYELALDSLTAYFQRMIEIFGKVDVKVVKGNHAGPNEYMLFSAIKLCFKNDPRITFDLAKSRSYLFREGNCAILLDHGDSEYVKGAKIPTGTVPREAYIQSKFMAYPELLNGTKQKIFLQGDLHHFEQMEYNGFEFIMCSSPVLGDRYADHLGKASRPRQNGLILGEDGLVETLHFYFD